jgi:uncharacterized membrane-anchored protein YjiN (DUF445 family)
MNDEPRRIVALHAVRVAALRRMKLLALVLLGVAVAGLLASDLALARGGGRAWGWLQAFCEAACVGALADWFAVVALFRHPMGLPLPHTAIIPQNKDRIADSLAEFVRDHFLEPRELVAKLAAFDPARRLADWLVDEARVRRWVGEARRWAVAGLDLFDDERMRRATMELVIEQVRRWNAPATAAEVLSVLTQGGRHHELLDAGLQKVAGFLAEEEVKSRVAEVMVRHARKEWPKIVGMVDMVTPIARIADGLADKLSASVLGELRDVLAQPDHPVRLRYEVWLASFIERLRTDESLIAAFDRVKERAVTDPAVLDYVASVWRDLKHTIRADLADDDSAIVGHVEQALRDIGARIAGDPELRASLNEHLLAAAAEIAPNLRSGVTAHVAQTVKAWEDQRLVDELELAVGKDLQFIRINGTLVGGAAGLLFYALHVMIA